MKTWCGLVLTLVMLLPGCAPGYYEKSSGIVEEAPGYYGTNMWYRNPETEEEWRERIWREESRR